MGKFSLEGVLLAVNGYFLIENIQTTLSFFIVLLTFIIVVFKLFLVVNDWKNRKKTNN